MHSIRLGSNRNVCAGIYEQACMSLCFADQTYSITGQRLQVADGKVFLPQLNKIHSTPRSLANLFQKRNPAGRIISRKLGAISDVVEKQYPILPKYYLIFNSIDLETG